MGNKEDLWLRIMKDMEQRRTIGLEQYKVPVTADEEVNWRQHFHEELLDALVYNLAAMELTKKVAELESIIVEQRILINFLQTGRFREPQ